MASKDQRYDPDINYDSDQEELNNTRALPPSMQQNSMHVEQKAKEGEPGNKDQWSVSRPSSPVDLVYLAENYIYNDVRPAAGMRSGGMQGGGQSDENKQQSAGKDSEPGGGQSDETTGTDSEGKKCIYCRKITDVFWSGTRLSCHEQDDNILQDKKKNNNAEHNEFCEDCAYGKWHKIRCPKHGGELSGKPEDLTEPYKV